jgi:microcystin-dependent protein
METFIGSIHLFAFNFTPANFLPCNGAMLPIAQNTALFSLLGTTYGGDGMTTFGIPKLAAPVEGMHYAITVNGIFPTRA